MKTQHKGKHYEDIALAFLKKHKLKLISRNYTCRSGEIDLIMQDKDTLVFVEVRYRGNSNYGSPEETINRSKQLRITKAAQHYLLSNNPTEINCRFDAIAIENKPSASNQQKINWIKNAFDAANYSQW